MKELVKWKWTEIVTREWCPAQFVWKSFKQPSIIYPNLSTCTATGSMHAKLRTNDDICDGFNYFLKVLFCYLQLRLAERRIWWRGASPKIWPLVSYNQVCFADGTSNWDWELLINNPGCVHCDTMSDISKLYSLLGYSFLLPTALESNSINNC